MPNELISKGNKVKNKWNVYLQEINKTLICTNDNKLYIIVWDYIIIYVT